MKDVLNFEGAGHSEAGPNHPHLHQHSGYDAIDVPTRRTSHAQDLAHIMKVLDDDIGGCERA